MTEPLLTTEQAAARLGLGKHTLEIWRMRGQGPVFRKLGGRLVRYAVPDLDAFVAGAVRTNTGGGIP
ncbi:helix-turn-helix transcriptional regulator [Novosphingobium sp.]|uniref:helix-turn-helix transcriptional regulator n=1 Tax=Novosphingobium sp. TaxID=1874826 RepID=UPI0038BC6D17